MIDHLCLLHLECLHISFSNITLHICIIEHTINYKLCVLFTHVYNVQVSPNERNEHKKATTTTTFELSRSTHTLFVPFHACSMADDNDGDDDDCETRWQFFSNSFFIMYGMKKNRIACSFCWCLLLVKRHNDKMSHEREREEGGSRCPGEFELIFVVPEKLK